LSHERHLWLMFQNSSRCPDHFYIADHTIPGIMDPSSITQAADSNNNDNQRLQQTGWLVFNGIFSTNSHATVV